MNSSMPETESAFSEMNMMEGESLPFDPDLEDEDKLNVGEVERHYQMFERHYKQVVIFEKQLKLFNKQAKKLRNIAKNISLNVVKPEMNAQQNNTSTKGKTSSPLMQEINAIEDKLDDPTKSDIIQNSLKSKIVLLDELNTQYKFFKKEEQDYNSLKSQLIKSLKVSRPKNEAQKQKNTDIIRSKLREKQLSARKLSNELKSALITINSEIYRSDPNHAMYLNQEEALEDAELIGNGINLIRPEFEAILASQFEYFVNIQKLMCGGSLIESTLSFKLNDKLDEISVVQSETMHRDRLSSAKTAKKMVAEDSV